MNFTYKVYKYSRRFSVALTDRELKRAFDRWSQYTNLNFEQKRNGPVDFEVGFEVYKHNDDYPFDGRGTVLAHAFYPVSLIFFKLSL